VTALPSADTTGRGRGRQATRPGLRLVSPHRRRGREARATVPSSWDRGSLARNEKRYDEAAALLTRALAVGEDYQFYNDRGDT